MTSAIDATKPTAGKATTASVRQNFDAAKTEIEALQAASDSNTANMNNATQKSIIAEENSAAAIATADAAYLKSTEYASTAEAISGTIGSKIMTPEKTRQAVQAYGADITGTIVLHAEDPPQEWLMCNGSAVSRTQYAALYAAIGIKYGAGNGTTTFNLPVSPMLPAAAPNGIRPAWFIRI